MGKQWINSKKLPPTEKSYCAKFKQLHPKLKGDREDETISPQMVFDKLTDTTRTDIFELMLANKAKRETVATKAKDTRFSFFKEGAKEEMLRIQRRKAKAAGKRVKAEEEKNKSDLKAPKPVSKTKNPFVKELEDKQRSLGLRDTISKDSQVSSARR